MKKILLFIAWVALLGLTTQAKEDYRFNFGDLRYEILPQMDNVVGVVDYLGEPLDVIIPSTAWYGDREYTVVAICDKAFWNCKMTSISIPTSVTKIGERAFYGCKGLTYVEIPSSVTSISSGMFEKCLSLTSVTIPSSVTVIGDEAFWDCYALQSVNIPSSVITIGKAAFSNCIELKSVVIPSSVTTILPYAFYGCSKLQSVTIPSSVTEIGQSAFWNCISLASVSLPDAITKIESSMFYGCHALASVSIPPSVTVIGGSAFEQCSAMTTVILPPSVGEIDEMAFWNCDHLTTIVSWPGVPPVVAYNSFYRVPADAIVYVPAGTLDQYPVAEGWNGFHDFRELGSVELTISPNELNLKVNESSTPEVTVNAAYDVTIVSESWTTSNPEVAIVDGGVVTAVGEGSATVSYTVIDDKGCPYVVSCDVFVSGEAGIRDMESDDSDAPVEYYNLNGVRVNSGALAPGLYIKRQGAHATKVIIR